MRCQVYIPKELEEVLLNDAKKAGVNVSEIIIRILKKNYKTKNSETLDYIALKDIVFKEIEEYIDLSEKKVYILDATAALYMIPIDRYNKNYDLFLIGNLGKDGEEGQIKNIKKDTEKVYLIMNDKNRRNWQNPERVRKYIIKNKQKIDEIGVFDVYE